ncbi:hypothetical protein CC86DRAFT_371031 [Ophiobolus disseminans]|uniref:Uncharacterized protein n=1 Tax=Ophiobolus disseminans TaxID=1469910 RepID=A0A6A6ZY33_9PLEO|nr:hypothetical protein CC86DRAFT_371031 [Ophiobolus disseminans]
MPSASQARLMFRSAARHLTEPHPFARNPITIKPHSWRAGDLSKKMVKTSAVYFPFYAAFLFWPVGAAALFNGRM